MAINECGEIIRDNVYDLKSQSGLKIMTLKERYEYLYKQISEINENLRTSNISVSINNLLDSLDDLMNNLSKDNQLMDIKSYIKGISATIVQVKLHDITRSQLVSLIQQMLNKIEKIIA